MSARPAFALRRLGPQEAGLHREVRLRALREAPDSFGETPVAVAARPSAYWEELTRSVTEPERQVMFLACEEGHVVGSAYGLLDRDRAEVGRVGGMWVDPAWRRRGVGRALLQEVFAWARGQGLSRLMLWAPSHSPAALALYARAGFRQTGTQRPLPTNPALRVLEMEAPLVGWERRARKEDSAVDDVGPPLGPGDRAPDFELPAADHDGRISLSDHYRRGPVLLLLLRGLYCAFCRRQISQLKPSCDLLQGGGISMLGVVIASPERSRLYFNFRARPGCPMAAAPDRSVHRAYGLSASPRTPERMAPINQQAVEILRGLSVDHGGNPLMTLHHQGGWEDTPEDAAEFARPLQSVGYYLIDRQGVIRWARVGDAITDLPGPESLLALV